MQKRRQQMTQRMTEWGRLWVIESDLVRCPLCHAIQTVAEADRSFIHQSGCRNEDQEQYPWRALGRILSDL